MTPATTTTAASAAGGPTAPPAHARLLQLSAPVLLELIIKPRVLREPLPPELPEAGPLRAESPTT